MLHMKPPFVLRAGGALGVGGENPGGHGGLRSDSERAQLADSHRRVSSLAAYGSQSVGKAESVFFFRKTNFLALLNERPEAAVNATAGILTPIPLL